MTSLSPASADTPDFADRLALRCHDVVALIGRLAMGWIFVSSGFGKITDVAAFSAGLAKRGVPAPSFFGWLGAIVEFAGGLMVIFGVKLRYAALLLILFVIVATAIAHRYWDYPVAEMAAQRTNFFKNLTILGGLLFMFLAGAGRLSIDGLLGRNRT